MNLESIKPLVEKKVNELGYELASLTYSYRDGNNVLSIIVDRVEPISMNDIVALTDVISPYMDEIVTDDTAYMLEVASLGAEKPLKVNELDKYLDSYVEVRLINPINGENIYQGFMKEVNNDDINLEIQIKSRKKLINITISNISKIRLAIKF